MSSCLMERFFSSRMVKLIQFTRHKKMDWLMFLFSASTFIYGVKFTSECSRLTKIITRAIFVLVFLDMLHVTYQALFKDDFLKVIAIFIYPLGNLCYALRLNFKKKQIVQFFQDHVNLMNRKQRRVAVICILAVHFFVILATICHFATYSLPILIRLAKHSTIKKHEVEGLLRNLAFPYYFWIISSTFLYGFAYFILHLRHMKMLSSLFDTKCYSYSTWCKLFLQIKFDYQHFDRMFSIIPSFWIGAAFLTVTFSTQLSKYRMFISIVFSIQDYMIWPFALVLVQNVHSKYCCSLERIIERVISNDQLTDVSKEQLIALLDRMQQVYVTASGLITLDKSLILPYLGSLFTFGVLFKDTFQQNGKS